MPKWVAVCLALATIASMAEALAVLSSYTLVKPFTLTITTAPNQLAIESVNFAYEPSLNQWTSCTMAISNSGSAITATVYVYLRNATGGTVAQGQRTQSFPSGTTTLTVQLTWAEGATAQDVAGGYIVIQP